MRSALDILGCRRLERRPLCKVASLPVRGEPGKWLVFCPRSRQRTVESRKFPRSVECFCTPSIQEE